ncbi:hypothetical protein D3C72_1834590 [compost metagenome]
MLLVSRVVLDADPAMLVGVVAPHQRRGPSGGQRQDAMLREFVVELVFDVAREHPNEVSLDILVCLKVPVLRRHIAKVAQSVGGLLLFQPPQEHPVKELLQRRPADIHVESRVAIQRVVERSRPRIVDLGLSQAT